MIGYAVADTVMTGRHDSTDLAALSLGAAVYVSVYIALTGIVQALIPVVGHHHGAGDANGVRRSFQQAAWLALAVALPGMAVLLAPGPLFALVKADPAVAERVRDYLSWLAWAPPKISQAFSGSFSARAPSCRRVTSSGRDRPWFSAP